MCDTVVRCVPGLCWSAFPLGHLLQENQGWGGRALGAALDLHSQPDRGLVQDGGTITQGSGPGTGTRNHRAGSRTTESHGAFPRDQLVRLGWLKENGKRPLPQRNIWNQPHGSSWSLGPWRGLHFWTGTFGSQTPGEPDQEPGNPGTQARGTRAHHGEPREPRANPRENPGDTGDTRRNPGHTRRSRGDEGARGHTGNSRDPRAPESQGDTWAHTGPRAAPGAT